MPLAWMASDWADAENPWPSRMWPVHDWPRPGLGSSIKASCFHLVSSVGIYVTSKMKGVIKLLFPESLEGHTM